MAYCSGCGSEFAANASFCMACDKVATVEENVEQRGPRPVAVPAEELEKLSDVWKKKFFLIEKAGGPKLPHMRELRFGEKRRLTLNVWAWLFGAFYYLTKGMWKKAIVLSALCLLATYILEVLLQRMGLTTSLTKFVGPAVFGTRANIDYYKKVVLGDNGWW